MLKIRHRVNTIRELKALPTSLGIELDLRSEGRHLIVQHDPFKTGECFNEYLKYYRHAFLIVNVKAEGLEGQALVEIKRSGVKNYFLLDLSFPALVKLVRQGEQNIAVRYSEYEPIQQCLVFKNQVRWVWIDCFHDLPLTNATYATLSSCFQLCVASPEIQGHPKETLHAFKRRLSHYDVEAICTKYPELW